MEKVSVIGGGSWGTAIIKMISDHAPEGSCSLKWWVRDAEQASYIQRFRHNPKYLSAVEIHPEKVQVVSDLAEAAEADLLIFAIPSAFLHTSIADLPLTALEGKTVVSAIKGIVPEKSSLVAEYFHRYYQVPYSRLMVITGPCHAEEVALEKLSYLTIAGQDRNRTESFARLLKGRYINTVISDDVLGTEYASVLKNIYAVASGICHGLGYGDNFQAVLIANALKEIEHFLDKVFPQHRQVTDSAYLGDLLVTAYSQFSRNRTFGNMIGKGYSVKAAQLEMNMIAEGYYAAKSVYQMNLQHQALMPVMNAMYHILYENKDAKEAIRQIESKLN